MTKGVAGRTLSPVGVATDQVRTMPGFSDSWCSALSPRRNEIWQQKRQFMNNAANDEPRGKDRYSLPMHVFIVRPQPTGKGSNLGSLALALPVLGMVVLLQGSVCSFCLLFSWVSAQMSIPQRGLPRTPRIK